MFDKLIQLILDFIDLFRFWEVIDETEMGLVYTFGRDTRVIASRDGWFKTGLHLIAPFNIEAVTVVNIQTNWDSTVYQSLQTKDGHSVVCQVAYKYRLLAEKDKVRKFIVELDDETATRRLAMGAAVAAIVEVSTLSEVREATEEGLNRAILELGRKELNPWGYKLFTLEWIQRTPSRTIRLMQDSVSTVNQIQIGDE
jgi:hypothetical protein